MKNGCMMLIAALAVASAAPTEAARHSYSTVGLHPDLPPPYASQSHQLFSTIRPFATGESPTVPPGFAVNRFATGLDSPRNLIVLPNGDVLVAEAKTEEKWNDPAFRDKGANRITLLRDTRHNGVADQRFVLIAGLRQPYGMTYLNGRLYIADTDGIFWVPYTLGVTALPQDVRKTQIARFAPGGYNNHWTRNIIASPTGEGIFAAVGSASNAGEHGEAEEHRRANILYINLKNYEETVYASGLRNPVGMDFEPRTGALWTVVNERDELGDDLVPDFATSVRKDGFYGWPYSYFGQHLDPRLEGKHRELVAKAVVPDFALGAHVAALGVLFGAKASFSQHYRNGAFVARHGSWNRSTLAGYDVVFIPFRGGRPQGTMEPFLTGFVADARTVHGRPRSLAIAGDGSLLVADDSTGTVWRIAAKGHQARGR